MAAIIYQKGDIFDSKAQVIVNTVNCEGFMGKGLALAFKQRYPDMFSVYQQECKIGRLRIGRPTLYKASVPWILNFPTKNHWRANSKLEYLEKGLEYLAKNYKEAGITSIAFPKLGAQNGKLSWDDVGPLMVKYLSQLDIDVYIYIAEGDREYRRDNSIEEAIWKHLNDLALSQDDLINEVKLSPKEAKKLKEYRATAKFTSLADIEAIKNLAKVSLKRIKEYVKDYANKQQYCVAELPEMPEEVSIIERQQAKNKVSSKQQKSRNPKKTIKHPDIVSLFPPSEIAASQH